MGVADARPDEKLLTVTEEAIMLPSAAMKRTGRRFRNRPFHLMCKCPNLISLRLCVFLRAFA